MAMRSKSNGSWVGWIAAALIALAAYTAQTDDDRSEPVADDAPTAEVSSHQNAGSPDPTGR